MARGQFAALPLAAGLSIDSEVAPHVGFAPQLCAEPPSGADSGYRARNLIRVIMVVLLAATALPAASPDLVIIRADRQAAPPAWAVLERQLMQTIDEAAPVYLRAFTYPGGTLRKGGKVDDDYQSFDSWPLFYAIGGDERLLEWALETWSGTTRQWDGRGSLREEFVQHYDMLHTSEGYVGFQFFGLADPGIPENVERACRFAGFYLGEDPEAPNYDAKYRILRSPLTGSAGPQFHADCKYVLTYGHASLYPILRELPPGWENDPRQTEAIQKLYDEVVLRGDVIMNLAVTGLVTNAYLYTGEEKYKRWVLDYVDGWMNRIRQNGGVIPDNVGLTGKIGEYRNGQWWGGFFGWNGRYSVEMISNALITAAECAHLVSGDPRYLDLLRSQVQMLLSHAVVRDGDLLVPYKYGPKGWEDYRPLEPYAVSHLWHASLAPEDWALFEKLRAGRKHGPHAYAYAESPNPPAPGAEMWHSDGSLADWTKVQDDVSQRNLHHINEAPHLLYLAGQNPDWPVKALEAEYTEVLRCLERIHSGNWEHLWKSQTVLEQNPVLVNVLAQATMGAPFTCFNGGLLQAAVRYFDADRKRPGLPPEVAALVEKIEPQHTVVSLVNTGVLHSHRVILEAGAFGEHQFIAAKIDTGQPVPVNGQYLEVDLPPGTAATLDLTVGRYSNRPSYASPFERQ